MAPFVCAAAQHRQFDRRPSAALVRLKLYNFRRSCALTGSTRLMGINAMGVLLLCSCWLISSRLVSAFPLYYSTNGSVLLTSTLGSNLTLRPDGAGAIVATSAIVAQGGVALNNTLLTDKLILQQNAIILDLQQSIAALSARLTQVMLPPTCSAPGGDNFNSMAVHGLVLASLAGQV